MADAGTTAGFHGHVSLDVAGRPGCDVLQPDGAPRPEGAAVPTALHAAFAAAAGPQHAPQSQIAQATASQYPMPGQQLAANLVPPLHLCIHRIDGHLLTSMSSPLVRVHLVDAATGFWRTKTVGKSIVFNLDSDSVPYLRSGKRHPLGKDYKMTVPWAADTGQSSTFRPFCTLPCKLKRGPGGVQQAPASWDEAFLISEPTPQNSALLIEVLDATTSRSDGDEDSKVVLSPIAWGFLQIDRALSLQKLRPRRMRVQLYKYRRRRFGWGRRAEEEGEMPLVVREYLDSGLGGFVEEQPGLLARMLTSLTGSGRQSWSAALEITLSPPQKTIELERVAEQLNSQVHETSRISAPTPEAAALAGAGSPKQAHDSQAVQEVKAAQLQEEILGHLAPHNLRQKDQACALPDSLLWQIAAGKRGASRLALSPSSTLVAAAIACPNGASQLRVFSLTTGRLYATCASGHEALVYDLCWHSWRSVDGAPPLLISCGGDGTVLIYEVPEDLVPLPGLNAPHLKLHAKVSLPSHVYTARPHPVLSADPRSLVLLCGGHAFGIIMCQVSREKKQVEGGFGGWVASMPVWQQQVRYEVGQPRKDHGGLRPGSEQAAQPSDVLCLRFSTQATSPDNLYVTDAAGHVMLFQVRYDATAGIHADLVRSYAGTDLAGTAIFGLEVVTQQLVQGRRVSSVQVSMVDDWVLLFARDHFVRLCSLQRGVLKVELKLSGIECGSYPVRGCMSPDAAYIACGSETGELFVWGTADGKQVKAPSVPQVRLAGPMMDIVWSEKQHLIACCALDDQAPPLLVFVGGDTEAPLSPAVVETEPAELLPLRPPPLRESRQDTSLNASSISPAIDADHQKWASQWINADSNPRSALTMEEKRRMKENILLRILDKKGDDDMQNQFGSTRALPGGL
eukprot:TRINITY_DN31622_c0_g1_i1.p1 TRINITY_DN31622_c0_g1~~TRINITY_DN31622_c0_g1_i1.p1  ORF type:complete len:907 (-),score=180.09 TRINITY_DN31622_c0_g1_i1:24-2744(-)